MKKSWIKLHLELLKKAIWTESTLLKRFEKYEFLTAESTAHNRLLTIVNWGFYQGSEKSVTDRLTDGQQTTNRQLTANKNVKNVKNEKKSNCRKQVYDESSIFYQLAYLLLDNIKKQKNRIQTKPYPFFHRKKFLISIASRYFI